LINNIFNFNINFRCIVGDVGGKGYKKFGN